MKEKLLKVKEGLEYIEFCTHMSCDTFNGKACDDNTKQAYEEQLYLIGYHVKFNIAILDSIISMLDSEELLSQYEGLALVDKSYISKIVEQIIHTRYTGMASFPVDHPEYKNEQFKSFNTAFCSKLFDQDATDLVEHLNNSKAAIESIME